MQTILVTGASGFVGGAVLRKLAASRTHQLVAALRKPSPQLAPLARCTIVTGLGPDTAWREALQGVDVVVHAAARVHIMRDTAQDPLAEFRRANVQGTLRLAQQAVQAGVKRFIFISSVKVHGEATAPGKSFRASDTPAPQDAYGISKYEAEQGLQALAQASGMELCIIRPPLVYGPGVKANFALLVKLAASGIPLPFASIDNKRSLVALENLADLIAHCAVHPQATGAFLVSDGEDISTPELFRRLAYTMGKKARLFPFPPALLMAAASIIGKRALAERVCGSLQVDISHTRATLGWSPPLSLAQGLKETLT